jgi:hypothetical protein
LTVRVLVANALGSTAITRVSKPIFSSFLDTRLVSPHSPLPALKAIQMGISRPQILSPRYQNQQNPMLLLPPARKLTSCNSSWYRLGVNSKT